MPLPMGGPPPPIPGVSSTEGMTSDAMDPMTMLAMALGTRPQSQEGSVEKMAQVVQLLREIAKEDPRIGAMASDALNALLQGPAQPPSGPPPGGGAGPQMMGGPGGAIPTGRPA